MLEKKLSLVISFKNTHDAMACEEHCLKDNVEGRLIPLPKEIDAGCGLAWKCKIENKDNMLEELKKVNITYDKMSEILI